jgi:hypothetical protein
MQTNNDVDMRDSNVSPRARMHTNEILERISPQQDDSELRCELA